MFPVVYGEWGSALKDPRDITVRSCYVSLGVTSTCLQCSCKTVRMSKLDTTTAQWLNDMIAYMNNAGAGNDGLHNAIGSWFW